VQIYVRWILTLVAAFAEIPAAAGNDGFLDTERAIKNVKEGKRQLQILDEWATQKSDQVERMQSRVAELTQQLNAQRTIASPEVIRKLENDLLQAQRAHEDAGRAFQSDVDSKRRELISVVVTRVRTVTGEYAVANGFDAIFLIDGQPLVYMAEGADITDEVILIYDRQYPLD